MKRWVRRLLIAVALLLAALFLALPYVDAFALIVRASGMPGTAGEIANWRVKPVTIEPVRKIPTRYGEIDAQIYRPTRGGVRRAVTLVPGVHMDGIRETRLVGLAEDLAGSGFEVLTVAPPDLQRFMITPRNTDMIEDAAMWLVAGEGGTSLPPQDRKIGMLGISFSGGLSIVAAGRPGLRDHVAFVMSFGGHGDLPRVMRYLVSGSAPAMPPLGDATKDVAGIEHLKIMPPHDYGVAVSLLTFADLGIVPPEQAEPLRRGVLTFLLASSLTAVDRSQAEAEFQHARDYAKTLPEPSRTFMTYVNDRAVDKLGPLLLPIVESLSDRPEHTAMSPERAPAPAAPVYLLHGAEDSVIPSVETVLLTNYLRGKTEVHAILSGLITHAEVDKSAAMIEVWRLVGFWKDLMAQ